MQPTEYEIVLKDSEVALDRLKALYEQWFQGIERLEPQVLRKQFERALVELKKRPPRNTALRFRLHNLQQRYTTLITYWTRVARQIEEGTFRRDVLRARRQRGVGDAAPAAMEFDVEVGAEEEFDFDALVDEALSAVERLKLPSLPPASSSGSARPASLSSFVPQRMPSEAPRVFARPGGPARMPSPPAPSPVPAREAPSPVPAKPPAPVGKPAAAQAAPPAPVAKPASPPPKRPASNPPPTFTGGAGPDEKRVRELFDRYVEARRKNNERVDNLRYEAIAKSIEQLLPKLQSKHRGKRIDFEVVVKDGKVGLKPVTK